MTTALTLSLVVASSVALAGCGNDEPSVGEVIVLGDSTTPDTPVTGSTDDGTALLNVTAPVVGGGTIDLTEYASQPLALWFWAPF